MSKFRVEKKGKDQKLEAVKHVNCQKILIHF